MSELNDLYDYGLKIYQNKEFFKFSIDSILLGEFVKIKPNAKILDICTGNAPIPLILSTKDNTITIDGVEIQEEVYQLAEKSININNLNSRIHIINEDIKNYVNDSKYDIVVCNPPYFEANDSTLRNENIIKQIARHEVKLTLEEAIKSAKKNLKENGTFYLVHRTERFLDVIHSLENNKFGIRNVAFIYTRSEKNAELFLIEASNYKKSDIKIKSFTTENLVTYKNIFKEG